MKKRNPATKLGEIKPCGSPWSRPRAEKKLTQTQAAELAGLSLTWVNQVERGQRTPGLSSLTALCALYDLTLEQGQELTRQTLKWAERNALQVA